MKRMVTLAATMALVLSTPRAHALDVGSDGLSGAFNPATNVQVDLSLATTGDLSDPGRTNGTYDPVRWAVIFKYASVNIPAAVTVTFKNHPSGAPVVWLVQGNTTISGAVNLNGSSSTGNSQSSPGGPGGFAGGKCASGSSPAAAGSGPGGGTLVGGGHGGSYGSLASGVTSGTYGSPEIIPLVGGSGGSGSTSWVGYGGSGGGGAILIACNGTITVGSGSTANLIYANSQATSSGGGAGSGGAIRLLASTVAGTGYLQAVSGSNGGYGRIRIEANSITLPAGTSPPYSAVSPLTGSEQIFPSLAVPAIRVSAINGVPVSATPNGEQRVPTDVNLTVQAPVQVDLISTNVPSGATVTLRVVPFEGVDQTYTATANGTDAWRVLNVTLPASGVASFVARAVLP